MEIKEAFPSFSGFSNMENNIIQIIYLVARITENER